jgi:hypothetical protein
VGRSHGKAASQGRSYPMATSMAVIVRATPLNAALNAA